MGFGLGVLVWFRLQGTDRALLRQIAKFAHPNNQEEEQRRRILLERERLEAEKRRFAEERLDEEHSRNTAREMKQNIARGKVQRNLCSISLHHCHISDWSNTEIVISDGWCDASSSLYFRV